MASRDNARAIALLDEGRAYLDAGNKKQAEACFRTAAGISDLPAARNNWALCRYLDGAHDEALEILEPVLQSVDPVPFAPALASLSMTALGEHDKAKHELQAAIRGMDAALAHAQWSQAELTPTWVEYTILIKQAAGALGLDRMVLDLHGRWPGRDLPGGAFAAGVAAFHLGRYEQAAKYWRRIAGGGWAEAMSAYARTADLAEKGLVPPFRLEYALRAHTKPAFQSEDQIKAFVARGEARVHMLASLFEPDVSDKAEIAQRLIEATAKWGVDLGRRLLTGSTVPMDVKLGAAKALTEAGFFTPNEPIPIVHQGKSTSILLTTVEFQNDSDEAEAVVEQAMRLRDAGKPDEAMELLGNLTLQGIGYPPAMMMQANIMRTKGELDGARRILEILEKLAPDDPGVLFNLAGLWIQYGDLAQARSYANRIQTADTSQEFQRMLAGMKAQLRQSQILTNLPSMHDIAAGLREEIEEQPISLKVTLAGALRQIPVEWLNAAATVHGLAPAKRRPEREKALAAALKDSARLRAALAAETSDVRSCLRYLVEAGGWCKLPALTKRFGTMDPDGFFWGEHPPSSSIGRLRVLGLIFVGRADIDGRRYKVAVVPNDLRDIVASVVR